MKSRCLDLDIGNSRTKWLFGSASGNLKSPRIPTLADVGERPDRVRISAVAGVRERLTAAIEDRFGIAPEFAEVCRELAGVVCCYDDPKRLGVDRWLALVAAWRCVRGAVAVVDAGTAITVDLVDGRGQHLGGYIVPGIGLMRRSLAGGTRDLALSQLVADAGPGHHDGFPAPGKSTDAAIAGGTLAMPIGFVDAVLARFAASSGTGITTFLCGGAAHLLQPRLASRTRAAPNLVLDGLAIALP